MTDNDVSQPSGEERLRAKRNKFWRYLILTFVCFMVAGYFSGYVSASYKQGELGLWLPLTAWVLVFIALIWFTWDFFRRVDELDLMDNLWAHLIGQYGAILLFMGWYFLADLGVIASYPTAVGIVLAMIGTTFVAYGLRKLGWR